MWVLSTFDLTSESRGLLLLTGMGVLSTFWTFDTTSECRGLFLLTGMGVLSTFGRLLKHRGLFLLTGMGLLRFPVANLLVYMGVLSTVDLTLKFFR